MTEQEQQLRTCLDGSTVMLWWMGQDGSPVTYNDNWLEFTGRNLEQELHLEWRGQNVHLDDRGNVLDTYRRCLEERIPFRQEYRCQNKHGDYRWILESGKPLFDENDRYLGYIGTAIDFTEHKETYLALAASEKRYRAIFDTAIEGSGIVVIDEQGVIESFNPGAERIFGYKAQETIGNSVGMLMPEPDRNHHQGYVERYKRTGEARIIGIGREVSALRKDGSLFPLLLTVGETRIEDKLLFTAILRDLTDLKEAQNEIYEEKERLQVTLECIGDAVITTDDKGVIQYLNPVAEKLTGWILREAKGLSLTNVFNIISEDNRLPCLNPLTQCLKDGHVVSLGNQLILISRSGTEYSIQNSSAPIHDRFGQLLGAITVFSDVTDQRRLTKQIAYQASHDPLTKLVNRQEFEKRLHRLLETAKQESSQHALCYLDLDQFKVVNDTCGHVAGDELLRQIATLLRKHIRSRDTLGRLGGDEFGILMEHCTIEQAKHSAETLRQSIENFRFAWGDKSFNVGVSLGIVAIIETAPNISDLLMKADTACYAAKWAGRNRTHIFKEDDAELAKQQGEMQWVSQISHALETNRFRLYYQPIRAINNAKERLHYELLLRMNSEDGQVLAPSTFIPAAERYGLSTKIDRWVIQTACRWLSTSPRHLKHLYQCSINLSGQSLASQEILTCILSQFDKTGIPPEKICFEITETAAIQNLLSASQFIETLSSKGCHFALDDFGSGLASFAYLKNLPVDYLKIDGDLVKGILNSSTDHAVVKAINEIGHIMGKQTIAEHVENDETLTLLTSIGVDFVQGFGIGKPQPIEELKRYALRVDSGET